MARIVNEELWKHPGHPGMLIVTTNAVVKQDGDLVMGRGAALEAAQKIPGIARECGAAVRREGRIYGFLQVRPPRPENNVVGFGIFQSKEHWKDGSDLNVIRFSTRALAYFASQHPDWNFRMNFPGIGGGGLDPKEVLEIVSELPDNVTLCHRGEVNPDYHPPLPPMGMKELYATIENLVRGGRTQTATNILRDIGFRDPDDQIEGIREISKEQLRHEVRARRRTSADSDVYAERIRDREGIREAGRVRSRSGRFDRARAR